MRTLKLIDADATTAPNEAYAAGTRCYAEGGYKSDNPYKRGTACREQWRAGWEDAEKLVQSFVKMVRHDCEL